VPPAVQPLEALCDRYVAELFAYDPGVARAGGDHSYDGRLGPVGATATIRRLRQLQTLTEELDTLELAVPDSARTSDERADAITLRQRVALERFQLVELDEARRNPLAMLFRGADPAPYCMHEYAPVPTRAEALASHLDRLPDWLEAGLNQLSDSLDDGSRTASIAVSLGLASFYSGDLSAVLPLPDHPQLRARLERSAIAAGAACQRFAATIEQRAASPSSALGEARFLSLLEAQEGVIETRSSLRRAADTELATLSAQFEELSARTAPGEGVAGAVRRMEADHPTPASLVSEASVGLDRIRNFWLERDVVTIPDAPVRVMPSPAFLAPLCSAAFFGAGTLAQQDVESNYLVTAVESAWSADQADEWLRSLNRWTLENIGVHEVLPGHFVHMLHARHQPSLIRRQAWTAGFGEGWAHYTEQLAIEHGLADGRPLLHLAQLQDALLRACRFSAALALHTEGASVDDVTLLFVEKCSMPEFPARREAERGTYDPMYLVYTYGKLQILAWRSELQQRAKFSLRRFHDTMIGSGGPPLAAVREVILATD
jgi:hypothetical protein